MFRILRDNSVGPFLQQFSIAPDMLVTLFLCQVAAVMFSVVLGQEAHAIHLDVKWHDISCRFSSHNLQGRSNPKDEKRFDTTSHPVSRNRAIRSNPEDGLLS
ncbi:hypothetical protein [Novosphingobium sp. B1]|uniref:hypothetical protein n=1 Tax=Novosphingobium sp. B1 TaxID=1938756 RepID=UPI0015948760|nr:hypothetical protein [Novosphingobium sp. B1]